MLRSVPVRLWLALLVVQALYWGLLSPYFSPSPRPLERLEQASFEVASVASPDWQAVSAAQFVAADAPWGECCQPGYRAVRIRFDLAEVPDEGLGEVPVIGADNYQTRVNGVLTWAEGRMDLPRPSYHGREYRGVNRLPAAVLRQGSNEIVYTLVRGAGGAEFFAAQPNLGRYGAIADYFGFTRFMLNDYLVISMVVGYLTALLALVAWARGGRQPYLLWLAVLAACWAGKIHSEDVIDPWLRGTGLVVLTSGLVMAIPLAWINLVNVWAGGSIRAVTRISLGLFGVALAVCAWLRWFPDPDAWLQADLVAFWFSGLAAGAVLVLLVRKIRWLRAEMAWEFAIFALIAMILVRDAAAEVFDLQNLGTSSDLALPFLLVALAAAFVARNVRLFQSREQIAALLQGQLDERTHELQAAHTRETALVRHQAHNEERARIMRDMHDGLGSSLMSMLLAARRGVADPVKVAEGLQSVVDDMRLMIDSMDSVGESLDSALTTFKARIAGRVGEAGFVLTWVDDASRPLPDYSPRQVLQVFRVLQEAVTNALKHSGGDALAITIADGERDGELLVLTVADNGASTTTTKQRVNEGRGLVNMAARSKAIGATIAFGESAVGFSVRLGLGAPTAAD